MVAAPLSAQTRTAARPRRGLFALGLLLATLAFVGVLLIGTTLASGAAANGQTAPVVVASRDIGPREVIPADALQVIRMPATAVPPGAFAAAGPVKGLAAQTTILKGQPITSNLVTSSPDQITDPAPAYLPIAAGFVAVTIPTNELQGVAGYVAAGDYINVLSTLSTSVFGAAQPKVVTRTVFTNLHVIRVGPALATATAKDGQRQGVSSSLTVVMTECDAQFLDWLSASATLKYVLLSYKDYTSTSPGPDPACPSTAPPAGIGPAQVDARFGFSKV